MESAHKEQSSLGASSRPVHLTRHALDGPGHPVLAGRIVDVLRRAGIPADLLPERGLDHGAWVPLSLMYPEGAIPVLQLSVQTDQPPAYHLELGRRLAPLRDAGVLILASGGATHDLPAMTDFRRVDPAAPYAAAFDHWLETVLTTGAVDTLLAYRQAAPQADRNHPFPAEHFLPLIAAAGAGGVKAQATRLHQHFEYGVLSEAAYRWD